jgi:hypothetical protein
MRPPYFHQGYHLHGEQQVAKKNDRNMVLPFEIRKVSAGQRE